jgi:2-(1,2-epoxy-1,2-dihydrophenyl)acetyl-CoA isomerase
LAAFQERGESVSIAEHLRHGYHRLVRQMVTLEKPIVGAINGVAAGAGCGVALAADIRVAADSASFMLAFSRIGLIPDSGVNWFLPRLIGYARAYEMAITASACPRPGWPGAWSAALCRPSNCRDRRRHRPPVGRGAQRWPLASRNER